MALERRRFADEPDAWGAPAPRRPAPLGPTPRVPAPVLFAVARVLPARERNYWRANPVDTHWYDAVSCGTETVAVVDAHHREWRRPPHPDRVERLVLLLAQGDKELSKSRVVEMIDEVARWGLQPTAVVVRGNPVIPGAKQEEACRHLANLFASMHHVTDLEVHGVNLEWYRHNSTVRHPWYEMFYKPLFQWRLHRLHLSNMTVDFKFFSELLEGVGAMRRHPHPALRGKQGPSLRELTLSAVRSHCNTYDYIAPTLEHVSRSLRVLDIDVQPLLEVELGFLSSYDQSTNIESTVAFLRDTLPKMSGLHTLRLRRMLPRLTNARDPRLANMFHMVFWAIRKGIPSLRALLINPGEDPVAMDDIPMLGGVDALFKLHDLRLKNVQLSGAVARELVEADHTRRLHTLHLDSVSVAPDAAHTLGEVVAALAPSDRRMRDVCMTNCPFNYPDGEVHCPLELWNLFRGARRLHVDLWLLLDLWPHAEASGHTKAMAEVLVVDMFGNTMYRNPSVDFEALCAAFGRMWHLQFVNYSVYTNLMAEIEKDRTGDLRVRMLGQRRVTAPPPPDHAKVLLDHARGIHATHLTLCEYAYGGRAHYRHQKLLESFPFSARILPHLAVRVFHRECEYERSRIEPIWQEDLHHISESIRLSAQNLHSLVLELGYLWSKKIGPHTLYRREANRRHALNPALTGLVDSMATTNSPIRSVAMFGMDRYADMMDLRNTNIVFLAWHVPKSWIVE